MPDIDGISLHEPLQHTNFTFPVIFCTCQELDERLNNALTNGVSRSFANQWIARAPSCECRVLPPALQPVAVHRYVFATITRISSQLAFSSIDLLFNDYHYLTDVGLTAAPMLHL